MRPNRTLLQSVVRYLLNLVLAVDFLGSAVTGGDPRETLSSRLGKAKRDRDSRLAHIMCGLLQSDPFHCLDSIDDRVGSRAVTDAVWPIAVIFLIGLLLLGYAAYLFYRWFL